MQPEYEKPTMDKPDFAKPYQPCYDYRNMENAGQYRGVGQAGKIGSKSSESIDSMPPKSQIQKVRRDHNG